VLAVIAVAACGSTASPTPSRSTAVTGTGELPAGTPLRTFSNAKLGDLLTRLDAARNRQGALLRDLSKATTGTPDQLRQAATAIGDWAAGESKWLDEHPADPCFQKAYDAYRKAVTDIGAAGAEFARLAASSSPPTDIAGQPAGAQLTTGVAEINEANALATVALRTCR
jgi:hypothetical protein